MPGEHPIAPVVRKVAKESGSHWDVQTGADGVPHFHIWPKGSPKPVDEEDQEP